MLGISVGGSCASTTAPKASGAVALGMPNAAPPLAAADVAGGLPASAGGAAGPSRLSASTPSVQQHGAAPATVQRSASDVWPNGARQVAGVTVTPRAWPHGQATEDVEILRRLAAIEAKVEDRQGLLQKLSEQQAQLNRLEALVRAGTAELPAAAAVSPSVPAFAATAAVSVAKRSAVVAAQGTKDLAATRSPRPNAPGRGTPGCGGAPERRRGPAVPAEGPTVAAASMALSGGCAAEVEAQGLYHTISGLPSCSIAPGAAGPVPRRMTSGPSPSTSATSKAAGSAVLTGLAGPRSPRGPMVPRTELESRLGELESALGLPLGGPESGAGPRRRSPGREKDRDSIAVA